MSEKASAAALSALHAAVARTLAERIAGITITTEDGKEVTQYASPAEITAAITFLKNNHVTADPAANEGLGDLQRALENRRSRRKLRVVSDEVENDFDRQYGS